MITSITYQNQASKNYLVKELHTSRMPLGTMYTSDLLDICKKEIDFQTNLHRLIYDFNTDLTGDIIAKFEKHLGVKPSVTIKTKTKRTYSVWGITVHEEDVDLSSYIMPDGTTRTTQLYRWQYQTLEAEYNNLVQQYGQPVKLMFTQGLAGYIDSRVKGNYSLDAIKQNFKPITV